MWSRQSGRSSLPIRGFGATAYDINNDGMVAGWFIATNGQSYAAVWRRPNQRPVADAGGPYIGDEGSTIAFSGAGSTDPDNDALTYAWNFGDGSTGTGVAPIHTYTDNGTYGVTLMVTDAPGLSSAEVATTATVSNVAPTITALTLPADPVPVGSQVTLAVSFTDPSTSDTHGATVDWDDGAGPVAAVVNQLTHALSATRTFATAGVYAVTVAVTDDDGASTTAYATNYIVVYDPSAGFVTGGGWINSPAGAHTPDPSLVGRANFGFVSRYQKGAAVPTGNTEFHFQAGNLNFESTSYDWLVVASFKAMYKGDGTVNGTGGYKFLLSAVDGAVGGGGGSDKFRIKLWNAATSEVIYDNQGGADDDAPAQTVLGGGSIVIHSK